MYVAAMTYCSTSEIVPGFQAVKHECLKQGKVSLLNVTSIAESLTDEVLHGTRVLEEGEIQSGAKLHEVVLINRQWFVRVERTIKTWFWETSRHRAYGYLIYAFWGVVIVAGIAANLWCHQSDKTALQSRFGDVGACRPTQREKRRLARIVVRLEQWFRSYITIPAAFGQYHLRLFWWCTIPSRFDSIIVFSFWSLAIALSCISYRPFPENYL